MPDTPIPTSSASVIPDTDDPFRLFAEWLDAARASEPNDPNALALATTTADGHPSVRMVLLKDVGPEGFTFYTNFESRKGGELQANPHAAMLFHWKTLRRQVRVEGPVTPVTNAEADAYFASRARISRLGALASDQSRPLPSRATLEQRVQEMDERYPGDSVPRPAHWSGFRLAPETLEFWQDMPFRLHDRRVWHREGAVWRREALYP